MKRLLPVLAPYIAVLIFWCVFRNAWLTILVYHLQILLWSRTRLGLLRQGWNTRLFLATALPCVVAGPLTYLLIPFITNHGTVTEWLSGFGLTGAALAWMVPYFGLVHPLLEEVHWSELRSGGWPVHLAFAGYHALVLALLLQPVWVALCLVVLFCASNTWSWVQSESKSGLLVCCVGHVLADLGIILAAVVRTW
jgi:hypothetical protein